MPVRGVCQRKKVTPGHLFSRGVKIKKPPPLMTDASAAPCRSARPLLRRLNQSAAFAARGLSPSSASPPTLSLSAFCTFSSLSSEVS